jgi:tRNA(Ile)-lysidine synthase
LDRTYEPLTTAETDRLLRPLARFPAIVLAVSGGADSLALLYLAAEWRARCLGSAPALYAVTVDHGLRTASADEAEFVAGHGRALGVSHTTLVWTGIKPASGLAKAARDTRYALLEQFARSITDAPSIAVVAAHHQDDQAETFVMRLSRGSGVDGLSAMALQRTLSPNSTVQLLRPLLDVPKTRLVASLQARGIMWIEDPSNRDVRSERVRVRGALPALAAAGVDAAAMATTARRMRNARDALDFATAQFKASLAVSFNDEIFASFDRAAFERAPELLRGRVLHDLIARFGGASPEPALSDIEALVETLAIRATLTVTLGGAVVSSGARTLRIWREAGRLSQPDVELEPGQSQLWDKRFWVRSGPLSARSVTVRPLGPDGYRQIAEGLPRSIRPPSRAAHALPSFWAGGQLVAVPALSRLLAVSPGGHSGADAGLRADPVFST